MLDPIMGFVKVVGPQTLVDTRAQSVSDQHMDRSAAGPSPPLIAGTERGRPFSTSGVGTGPPEVGGIACEQPVVFNDAPPVYTSPFLQQPSGSLQPHSSSAPPPGLEEPAVAEWKTLWAVLFMALMFFTGTWLYETGRDESLLATNDYLFSTCGVVACESRTVDDFCGSGCGGEGSPCTGLKAYFVVGNWSNASEDCEWEEEVRVDVVSNLDYCPEPIGTGELEKNENGFCEPVLPKDLIQWSAKFHLGRVIVLSVCSVALVSLCVLMGK